MTFQSLKMLAIFLNKYPPRGSFADYGGTDKIGSEIVRKMLSLKNVDVEQGAPGADINLLVRGTPKKIIPGYKCLDYDNGIDLLQPIASGIFDCGICMDLLEHVTDPFTVANNIYDSLKRGAMLFVTVPFVWEIHNYPGDYWRFTPQGVETLFSRMKVVSLGMIKDHSDEEQVQRQRVVAVFKKNN